MGEKLIDKCCLYFTDLDGNPIELGKLENLSLSYDEENPPNFNMTLPEESSLTLEVNDEDFCDKIKDEFEKIKTIQNINTIDSLDYIIEKTNRLIGKYSYNFEEFAEYSKIAYNKEKEKKGEEKLIAIVRFWDKSGQKLGNKDYHYFIDSSLVVGNGLLDPVNTFYITNELNKTYDNPVSFICILNNITEEIINKTKHDIVKVDKKTNISNGTAMDRVTKIIENGYEYYSRIALNNISANFPSTIRTNIKSKEQIEYEKNNNKKEKEQMNLNRIFPSEFIGRDDNIKMSIYGAAFRTGDNRDISFSNGEWIDVTGLTFDFECPAYVLPAKKEDVTVGDFILHVGSWCRVIEVKEKTLMVERIYSREISEILPTKSPFGFDFYSKLFMPFFGNIGGSVENLMSNPMALMMLCGDSNDFSDMLPFMFMNGSSFDMSNPMMLYFLMKGNKENKKAIELGF